jgi:hypothetical protein
MHEILAHAVVVVVVVPLAQAASRSESHRKKIL